MLAKVRIPSAASRLKQYPHEMSGGSTKYPLAASTAAVGVMLTTAAADNQDIHRIT